MGELFGTAKKAIGMTATLNTGSSSGLFHLFEPHRVLWRVLRLGFLTPSQ
jgi:hypothetical protein